MKTELKSLSNTLKAILRGELTYGDLFTLHAPVIVIKAYMKICGKLS